MRRYRISPRKGLRRDVGVTKYLLGGSARAGYVLTRRKSIHKTSACNKPKFRGAGLAQWSESSPPSNVARVRFLPGAMCGLSLVLVLALL